ncbi:MAG: DUF4276 family protein [Anaerolineae bacterium]|nr:DUF4276 family protein [Anaerolineae bacterium]
MGSACALTWLCPHTPNCKTCSQGKPEERVKHVERAIAAEIGDERFLPFLTLHEFEALLLVDPSAVGEVVGQPKRVHCLTAAIKNTPPEEINDTAHNHPSALIRRCFPEYNKTVHGLRIAKQIGLAAIRSACPHFNEWVTALEQL